METSEVCVMFGSDHLTRATLTSFPFTDLDLCLYITYWYAFWIRGSLVDMFISKLKYNKIQTLSVYKDLSKDTLVIFSTNKRMVLQRSCFKWAVTQIQAVRLVENLSNF